MTQGSPILRQGLCGRRSRRDVSTDDGIGGADSRNGSGLLGLTDRVEALGGRLQIASPLGNGTSLHVTIPLIG